MPKRCSVARGRFVPAPLLVLVWMLAAWPLQAGYWDTSRHAQLWGGLLLPDANAISVASVELSLHCAQGGHNSPCDFTATYLLHNSSADPLPLVAVLRPMDVAITAMDLAGHTVNTDLDPAQQEAAGALLGTGPDLLSSQPWARLPQSSQPIAFSLMPGRHAFTVTGTLELSPRGRPGGFFIPAVSARHLWLGGQASTLTYHLDLNPGAGDHITVDLEVPGHWQLNAGQAARQDDMNVTWNGATGWDESPSPQGHRYRRTYDASDGPFQLMTLTSEPGPWRNGGVLLGAGSRADGDAAFIARLGYEIAYGDFLLIQLSAESDFTDHLNLVPVVAVATPWLFVIPTLSAGLGLPVQIAPTPDIGVRLHLDLAMGPIGMVYALDVFPMERAPSDSLWRHSLFGQISF